MVEIMATNSLAEILSIKTEIDLKKAIEEFETTVENTFKPLADRLRQQVLTSEVSQIELHMTFVESWRDRVAKALMYSSAFENHGKSHHFLLSNGPRITTTDREAYQKSITTAASALS